jgi:galactokinase
MIAEYRRIFGHVDSIRVFRAPGRVNLIGEHTDYNLGFVLPVALDLATYIATAPASDGKLEIFSEQQGTGISLDAAALRTAERGGTWTDYPVGVAHELIRSGFPIEPAGMLVRSTVPEGAGLSSSAALEVSSALAMLGSRSLPPTDLARLCQRAEVQFVGMPCGIMDQYISIFGRENSAVEIDCRSLEHRNVHLPDGIVFIAVNSMVKHALAGSAYRERVQECAAAVELLRQQFPGATSLRDISPAQFQSAAHTLPPVIARRARHVVTENDRVERFVAASAERGLAEMGRLLVESHRSLQHDYEVSCPELDFLVDTALAIDGVYGSRMTGGGFGGCTVTMLRPEAADHFRSAIARAYEEKFQRTPRMYDCRPSKGAGEVPDVTEIPDVAG